MSERNRLAPCADCRRHVRVGERACPFCGAAIALHEVVIPAAPAQRLGRAALFAFGTAVVTSAPGCYLVHERGEPLDGRVVDAARRDDAGSIAPPYGIAPEEDAASPIADRADAGAPFPHYGGPFPIDAGQSDDAGADNHALYGGPPDDEGGGSP
jgi:hypothetical protein